MMWNVPVWRDGVEVFEPVARAINVDNYGTTPLVWGNPAPWYIPVKRDKGKQLEMISEPERGELYEGRKRTGWFYDWSLEKNIRLVVPK